MRDFVPRKLLITGASGFIMSHVVDRLLADFLHLQVTVIDIMDYCASMKNLEQALSSGRCRFVKGDIRNDEFMLHLIETEKPDSIIHGAAITHVDLSFGDSLNFTRTNTYGTHVMLESMRIHNARVKPEERIERFLYICTDEVYGSVDGKCDESSPIQPTNPYAASKAAASMICKSYIKSYGLPIIETRGNNTIGTRQYPEKLIPKFVSLLLEGRPLPIHGQGTARRSFIDVEDCARAIVTILTRGRLFEVYNIEAGVEMTVQEVAHRLLQKFHIPEHEWPRFLHHVEDRAFNDVRYSIDGSKLRLLKFEPRVSFDESLDRIIRWYRDNRDYWPNSDSALVAHPKLSQYVR